MNNKNNRNTIELIEKLYNYLDLNIDSINNDIKNSYLTENLGMDGDYIWYYDGTKEGAIKQDTAEIFTSKEDIDRIFNLGDEE